MTLKTCKYSKCSQVFPAVRGKEFCCDAHKKLFFEEREKARKKAMRKNSALQRKLIQKRKKDKEYFSKKSDKIVIEKHLLAVVRTDVTQNELKKRKIKTEEVWKELTEVL